MKKRILATLVLITLIVMYALPVYAADSDYYDYSDVIVPDPLNTTSLEEAKAMYPSGYHKFYIVNDIKYATPDGQIFDDVWEYMYYMRDNYEEYADAKSYHERETISLERAANIRYGRPYQDWDTFYANWLHSWEITRKMINEGRIETISAIYVDLTYDEAYKLGLMIDNHEILAGGWSR